MDGDEQLDLLIRATDAQIDLTHKVMEKHLNESDRMHARKASEKLVDAGIAILSDPTSVAP